MEETNRCTAPVYKRGNKTDCRNYRGMSLLSTVYKIIAIVLLSGKLHMQRKLLGVVNVAVDVTGQPPITNSAFVKYLRKDENIMRHCISYL
jgi:hypothetical protein